jgi:hypothetical protein
MVGAAWRQASIDDQMGRGGEEGLQGPLQEVQSHRIRGFPGPENVQPDQGVVQLFP